MFNWEVVLTVLGLSAVMALGLWYAAFMLDYLWDINPSKRKKAIVNVAHIVVFIATLIFIGYAIPVENSIQ